MIDHRTGALITMIDHHTVKCSTEIDYRTSILSTMIDLHTLKLGTRMGDH